MITDKEDFKIEAYPFMVEYAKQHKTFLVEDVRIWAYKNGLEEAENPSWWGGVTRKAIKEGIISKTGQMGLTKSNVSGSWHHIWGSTIYGAKLTSLRKAAV